MSLAKIVENESKSKEVFEVESPKGISKQNFFWKLIESFKLLGRKVENTTNYTVCMDSKEDAVYTFRVCNDRIRGIMCYDIKDKLKIIRIKDREYLICPRAKQAYNETDYDRFRIDK